MIASQGQLRAHVATRPVDVREGRDGRALAVREPVGLDPSSGAVVVVRSKRAGRIEVPIWDRTGLVLVRKRPDKGTFIRPQVQDGVPKLSPAQVPALSEGVDWRRVRPEAARRLRLAGQMRPSGSGAGSGLAFESAICVTQHRTDAALAEEDARLTARPAET